MRKILSIFLLLAAMGSVAPAVSAQTANTPFTAPQYYATSFQLWSINQQSPNTYIFQGRNLCNSQGQNMNFFVFSTTAPVLIADSNSANSEVVTPSAIVNTAGSCGATVAPSHNHYTFQMKSGTAGLQEAINTLTQQGGQPAVVVLDKNWWDGVIEGSAYAARGLSETLADYSSGRLNDYLWWMVAGAALLLGRGLW